MESRVRVRVWEEVDVGLQKVYFQMNTEHQFAIPLGPLTLLVCSDLARDMRQEEVLSLVFAIPAAAALTSRCVLCPPPPGQ